MIERRTIGRAGHVARVAERRNIRRVLGGNQKERDHLEDLGIDETITLKSIFK